MARATRNPPDARARLAVPVGVTVTIIWAISAVVGLVTKDFQGLEIVSPVMVIFSGYLFGINIVRTGEKRLLPTSRILDRTPTRGRAEP